MPIYDITVSLSGWRKYQVEAENVRLAINAFEDGDAESVDEEEDEEFFEIELIDGVEPEDDYEEPDEEDYDEDAEDEDEEDVDVTDDYFEEEETPSTNPLAKLLGRKK